VNDVSAGRDPDMLRVVAEAGAGLVVMHMRGTPATMQADPRYDDVVGEVRDFLVERAGRARAAGVAEVWIDPGIGFGKTAAHNLSLLRHAGALVETGLPVLVGTSRKGFLQRLLGAPADDVLEGSLTTAVMAMQAGVAMVRAHDVGATVAAARLVGAAA
ncbi:MAG TPA: dihydropteroate synthase, partial [Acidimicrobiales bacterium]|nr:dihydropteroate synthase [Acidimicrobiales bacterium]